MVEDEPNFQTFKNIKSKLYKVASHETMFPCEKSISWIVKHVDLETRYILNAKIHPITSIEASIIYYCYHLEEIDKSLDEKPKNKFLHNPKDILKAWYNLDKVFKSILLGEYPTNLLKMPYQYAVAMLCILYEESDAQRSRITWVPLLYYVIGVGSYFN
jgi:hypothetical protein